VERSRGRAVWPCGPNVVHLADLLVLRQVEVCFLIRVFADAPAPPSCDSWGDERR
jgi:hypothetical protein